MGFLLLIDIAQYLPGVIAAYTILFVGASSPGPSVAMLIGIATEQGRTPALVATLGIAFGSVTVNILTLLGVGLIVSQAAWAMSLLLIIGGIYLLYLAYGAFKKSVHPPELQPMSSVYRLPVKHFIKGYLLQVTNPKTISFWLAIASVGAVDGASAEVIVLFAAGGFLISFTCHGAWALALSIGHVRSAYFAKRRWIEATLGCFLTFFAFKLVSSER
ncbi:MAG: threonine/homoserine/homoserine lactone efflux protein [Parasphingorhabdus sp.]|jgi:threonine/homoserine/homoserine lactone efflux protein